MSAIESEPQAPATIRRSARARRVSVRVDPSTGAVEVVAPVRAAQREIDAALVELTPWIARRQAAAARVRAQVAARGDAVPYLGQMLTLEPDRGRRQVRRHGERLLVPEDPELRLAALERWYRRRAQVELAPRVAATVTELARSAPGRLRHDYRKTVIRAQRTRWGSCSQTGTISLNWRLMLAPDEVADYVVVHEVCHLAEMNHSPAYWGLVALLFPEYERPRRWLRAHGATLALDGGAGA